MTTKTATPAEYRASNGIFYRMMGEGEPLLLLHGLLASGAMFDPLTELLRDRFRMLIPDLRGHGNSGGLGSPYDVPAPAACWSSVPVTRWSGLIPPRWRKSFARNGEPP